MKAAVLFVLASLLSGIPATAVLCDLWLCDAPAAALADGCHEHGASSAGEIITASTDSCTHFTDTALFVSTTPRAAPDAGGASFAPAPPAAPLKKPASALLAPAHPGPLHVPLVLRI